MQQVKSFFRKATPELPLSVYYFAASYVDEKPQPLKRGETLLLIWMQQGEVHFYTSGGKDILRPGDICITPPNLLRSIHTVRTDTRYILLSFSPKLFPFPADHFFAREFFTPMRQGTLEIPRVLHPDAPGYEAVLVPLQRLDVAKEGSRQYDMELLSITMEVCAALYPLCSREASTVEEKWSACERCLRYIEDHYEMPITLEELAHHVHLHPNYLCALFREETGKTVVDQINWVRVHAASKLLRSTDLPVGQVAAKCGFQSANYFSRIFRKYLDATPSQYRKSNKQAEK